MNFISNMQQIDMPQARKNEKKKRLEPLIENRCIAHENGKGFVFVEYQGSGRGIRKVPLERFLKTHSTNDTERATDEEIKAHRKAGGKIIQKKGLKKQFEEFYV